MAYELVQVERRDEVGLVTMSRPKALNALNAQLISEIEAGLSELDRDDRIGAMVLTGSDKAFAAGADIKEMVDRDFTSATTSDFIAPWQRIAEHRKPLIAAVAGFALGGGCELAMMCDLILAADNAKFGQPEITIGTIPGAGGTQRLVRAVGKAKAMELVLTGRIMDAVEAERSGLVARVVPAEALLEEAVELAATIAAKSRPIVAMARDAVNAAYECSLAEGLKIERRLFYATFATADRREGMSAFVEKRSPRFIDR
jgi:enoyl-CoA hydratase